MRRESPEPKPMRPSYYKERVEDYRHKFRAECSRRVQQLWEEIISEAPPPPAPSDTAPSLVPPAPPAPPPTPPQAPSTQATGLEILGGAPEAAAQARAEEEQHIRRRQEWEASRVQLRNQLVSVPWNNAHAIETYQERCKTFDKASFDNVTPVTFDMVPWPVLKHPLELTKEDITASRVDEFFETALRHRYVPYEKLKVLILKSIVRWHPDRWRSRGIFNLVDGKEKALWEALVTEVAQSLMPMREEVREDTFIRRLTVYRSYS